MIAEYAPGYPVTACAEEFPKIKTKPETVVRTLPEKITGYPFYSLSKLDLPKLLDAPNDLARI